MRRVGDELAMPSASAVRPLRRRGRDRAGAGGAGPRRDGSGARDADRRARARGGRCGPLLDSVPAHGARPPEPLPAHDRRSAGSRRPRAPASRTGRGSRSCSVMGDAYLAQAVWSAAHGMVVLELDGRYPPGSDLGRTWREAAESRSASSGRPLADHVVAACPRRGRATTWWSQTWAVGSPMSGSDPMRTAVARPSPSSSKLTRWPWRSIRKIEPSSASAASDELVRRSVSRDDDALARLRVVGAHDALHRCGPTASAPCPP